MTVTLYHYGMSTCSGRVRMALAEKGVRWESRHVDLRAGEQRSPEYLKLNPAGVVPTLVDGTATVVESTIICEYIDEAFDGPELRPGDAQGRARMRMWCKRLDDGLHFPATYALSFGIALRALFLEQGGSVLQTRLDAIADPRRRQFLAELIEKGVEAPAVGPAVRAFDRLLADIESALEQRPWLAGEQLSLADIAYAPYMARLDSLQMQWLWEPQRARVADWYQRLQSRPSFRPAVRAWFDPRERKLMEERGLAARERLRAYLD